MKKRFTIGMLGLLCLFTTSVYSQIQDSIHVRLSNDLVVSIKCQDYSSIYVDASFWGLLSSFQADLQKVEKEIDENSPLQIEYTENQSMQIQTTPESRSYILSGNDVSDLDKINTSLITGSDYSITIYFVKLSQILDNNFISELKAALQALPEKHRFAKSFEISGSEQTYAVTNEDERGRLDMLELSPGVGASLLKEKWAVDLGFKAGFKFAKKGVERHQFYVSDNLYYVFNSSNRNINNFVNLGYALNTKWSKNEVNWIGIEVGYLTNSQGDFFKENTFRVGLSGELGNGISVSPHFYLGEGNNFPGIRIGFGF